MEMIFSLLLDILNPEVLLLIILGVTVGIIGGALPGISSTTTVALVATFAYSMKTVPAILFLAATQVGSTYGGSITAVVLNIPGTPASAATALEGYPMAKRGEGERALAINIASSFWGNTLGAIFLVFIMPIALKISLSFGSWEMFWFSIFAIVICAQLSRKNFVKGLFAAALGLIVSFVGMDPIHGFGALRFTYGINHLKDGIQLVPAMVGLYGMSEVFTSLTKKAGKPVDITKSKVFTEFKNVWRYKWLALRVSVLGFIIGIIPGVGSNIASWVGYNHASSTSKNPDKFGTGYIEGLVGSEASNNACVPGTYAPLLSLGVPGDGVTAVVLSVLTVQGIQMGSGFMQHNPGFIELLSLAFIISGIVFVFIGSIAGKGLVRALSIPLPSILAVVVCLCAIGAYSTSNSIADIRLMFIFGLIGLAMNAFQFPIAPMIIGIVVGGSLVDATFRRAFIAGKGSLAPFFTRPASLILIVFLLVLLFLEYGWKHVKSMLHKNKN